MPVAAGRSFAAELNNARHWCRGGLLGRLLVGKSVKQAGLQGIL